MHRSPHDLLCCVATLVAAVALLACGSRKNVHQQEQPLPPPPVEASLRVLERLPKAEHTLPTRAPAFVTVRDSRIFAATTTAKLRAPASAVDSANLVDRLLDLHGQRAPETYRRGTEPLWSRTHRGDHRYEISDFSREKEVRIAKRKQFSRAPLVLLDRDTPGPDIVWMARSLGTFKMHIAVNGGAERHAVAIVVVSDHNPLLEYSPTVVLSGGRLTIIGDDGLTVVFEPLSGQPDYARLRSVLALPGFGSMKRVSKPAPPPPTDDEGAPILRKGHGLRLVNRDQLQTAMPILDMAAEFGIDSVSVASVPPALQLYKYDGLESLKKEIAKRQRWKPVIELDRVEGRASSTDSKKIEKVFRSAVAKARRRYALDQMFLPSTWTLILSVNIGKSGNVENARRRHDSTETLPEQMTIEGEIRSSRFSPSVNGRMVYVRIRGTSCWLGSDAAIRRGTNELENCKPTSSD